MNGLKKAQQQESDNSLQIYYKQIKDISLLSFEEELELSREIMSGNQAARDKLIRSNLRLVIKIAKKYMSQAVTLLDLIQEGNLGLMRAAEKFDYRREVRFSTYAVWWIKQSIVRYLSTKCRTIRLPYRKEEKLRKLEKVCNQLYQSLMKMPTSSEIAIAAEIDEKEVEELLNVSNPVVSLDGDSHMDNGTLKDVLEDDSYDPSRELMRKSLHEDTLKTLARLKMREKVILLGRHSFYGSKKETLKSLAAWLGIAPETVRQIELRALKKLRETAGPLQEYCC